MPFIVGAAVIFVLVVLPLWRRYSLRRANAKFQRSIWIYDEARRARIVAGADPRSIPTAEENLRATGFASQVKNIERLPRPDPLVVREALLPADRAASAGSAASPLPFPARQMPIPRPTPASRVPSPGSPPPSRPPLLPDREIRQASPSLDRPAVAQATGPSLQYRMTYATEWGEVTERRIRLRRAYSEHGEVYVEAHCYLRRAQRTFRADRMSDLVEVDTDCPIVDPAAHFLGFIAPEEIVTPGHELVMAKARPGLHAMVWIGRAGGELDPATIALLSAFCSDRARIGKGATDFNVGLAERWIADDRPTFDIASAGVARMKRGGPEWQMTYDRARDVAALGDAEKRGKRLTRLFRV